MSPHNFCVRKYKTLDRKSIIDKLVEKRNRKDMKNYFKFGYFQ